MQAEGVVGMTIASDVQMLQSTPTELLYEVLVNEEDRFALWPAGREVPYSPDGWRDTGKRGTETECLEFIAAHEDAGA
jgi:MbtH protein